MGASHRQLRLNAAADVGAVVVTHGTGATSLPLLESLLEEGFDPSRIVLVQNPVRPDDPSPTVPDTSIPVRRMPGNLGYAAAMNAGIRHHLERGQASILLLTHDVRLRERGALQALEASARAHPDFGILGPALWWRSEGSPYSFGGVHRPDGTPVLVQSAAATDGDVAACDWVDGAAMLIRREVFEAVGFLEERFFLYFEETELCLRAKRAGWRVGVVLTSELEQEPGLAARPHAYTYLLARNGLEYARRWGGAKGVRAALRRQLLETVGAGRVIASPRTPTESRRETWLRVRARWLGVRDYGRRRSGPPPRSVTEESDLR